MVTDPSCPTTSDANYGYTAENSIKVGGGIFTGGIPRQRAFLDALRGPQGQSLTYQRVGSVSISDTVIVDAYQITYAGLASPITLYLNVYEEAPRFVPVGFTCGSPIP